MLVWAAFPQLRLAATRSRTLVWLRKVRQLATAQCLALLPPLTRALCLAQTAAQPQAKHLKTRLRAPVTARPHRRKARKVKAPATKEARSSGVFFHIC
jgi:hypothetical protein